MPGQLQLGQDHLQQGLHRGSTGLQGEMGGTAIERVAFLEQGTQACERVSHLQQGPRSIVA
jgi:hypothetical protein